MKVLHVVESAEAGGAQRAVEILANELPRRGIETAVAVPFDGPLANRVPNPFELPISRRIDRRAGLVVAELVRRHGFDIVHVHTPKAGMLVRGAAKRAGAKVVMHVHGLGNRAMLETLPLDRVEYFKKRTLCALEKLADRHTDRFIFVCEADRNRGFYPYEKSSVVYNGVDCNQWRNSGQGEKRVILFPARPSIQKDPETLLKAVRMLDDFTVLIPSRENIGVDHEIEYIDPDSSFHEHYKRASLVVLTTHWEGQPFAVLEAMAAGKPIIATDTGGIPETLGDTGWLVPRGDHRTLAETIRTIIRNPEEANRRATAARERVERLFTIEKMVEGTINAYKA